MTDHAMARRLRLGDVLWNKLLRPRLFARDAEPAHLFTVQALRRLQALRCLWIPALLYRGPLARMPVSVFGQEVPNPVWLAAGFDKHGEVIPALEALGFGAVERLDFTHIIMGHGDVAGSRRPPSSPSPPTAITGPGAWASSRTSSARTRW